MRDYNAIKAMWERACKRFLDTEGAYSDEARIEMWFLCEALEDILELPSGASSERIKELAEERRKEIVA